MYITYLDQNALIDLGVRARRVEFREKLDAAIGSGAFTPMVSSWHLVETANTTNLANASAEKSKAALLQKRQGRSTRAAGLREPLIQV